MNSKERKQADSHDFTSIRQIVIFDGDCAMCSRFVTWSVQRLRVADTGFVASQSEQGQVLLRRKELEMDPSTVYLLNAEGVLNRSDAILELSKSFRNPYSKLAFFAWVPRWLRDGVYRFVAWIRRWIPSRKITCEIDGPRQRLLLGSNEDHWPEWLRTSANAR